MQNSFVNLVKSITRLPSDQEEKFLDLISIKGIIKKDQISLVKGSTQRHWDM